jgi:hypothetical protein
LPGSCFRNQQGFSKVNRDRKKFSRRRITELLRAGDLDRLLAELRQWPPQKVLNPLLTGICNTDEQVKWHAVVALGQAVAQLAEEDMEAARVVMRRFMWSLNDESGGIGWGVPEAMGEVLAAHGGLAEEYGHILVSFMREDGFYLEYPPLQRGLMWSLGRLAKNRPDLLRARKAHLYLRPYLASPDGSVRGLAALALGHLKDGVSIPAIAALRDDAAVVRFHEEGEMRSATVGELASRAIAAMQAESH